MVKSTDLDTETDIDTTIFMTLTSTTTVATDTAQISWSKTTLTTQQVISRAITISKSLSTSTEPLTESTSATDDLETSSIPIKKSTSTTASIATTVHPSDYSTRLQFGDIPSSNSSQVGVAIGVPIAVFIIFFISLGIWYFLRLKRAKNANKTMVANNKAFTFDPFDDYNNNYVIPKQRHAFMNQSSDTLNEKPYPNLFSPTNYLNTAKELEMYQQQQQQQQVKNQGYGPKFRNQLNRLSRMWPKRDKSQEFSSKPYENQDYQSKLSHQEPQTRTHQVIEEPQQPNCVKQMSMITPIFLKKFNLKNLQLNEQNPKIKPQTINIPHSQESQKLNIQSHFTSSNYSILSNQSKYIVIKNYNKNLNDEISIEIGQKCHILEKYSDGWCKINLISKSSNGNYHEITGLVPRMCLQKV
ncbi:FUS1 [Candida pseudojiufengensis]|uniref:FUS1 n=1 Tax=Candida pseudojiufengensis TaxID=497109 RepID=UPI0022250017|nr:FUS1 [Candida pseudojiufengensis]KAI5963802.1 FUS1 [Candida pseudojiufengensis]